MSKTLKKPSKKSKAPATVAEPAPVAEAVPPATTTTAPPTTLEWEKQDDDTHVAYTGAFDDDLEYPFVVARRGNGWGLDESDEKLLPTPLPGPFASLHQAKEACEGIAASIKAAVADAAAATGLPAVPAGWSPDAFHARVKQLRETEGLSTDKAVVKARREIPREPVTNNGHVEIAPVAVEVATTETVTPATEPAAPVTPAVETSSPAESVKVGSREIDPTESLKWFENWGYRMTRQRHIVTRAEEELAEISEQRREAKKFLEREQDVLNAMIDERESPLFPVMTGLAKAGEASTASVEASADCADSCENIPDVTASTDESWRQATLKDLDIAKPSIVKALAEHTPPLETLGALADWTTAKGQYWSEDIKGVGKAAAEYITDKTDAYWAKHPRTATAGAKSIDVSNIDTSAATSAPAEIKPPTDASPAPKADTPAGLGITREQIEAAAYPAILEHAADADAFKCPAVVELLGAKWIAVPALMPADTQSCDYLLTRLHPRTEDVADDGVRTTGMLVEHESAKWLLGPRVEAIPVRVEA